MVIRKGLLKAGQVGQIAGVLGEGWSWFSGLRLRAHPADLHIARSAAPDRQLLLIGSHEHFVLHIALQFEEINEAVLIRIGLTAQPFDQIVGENTAPAAPLFVFERGLVRFAGQELYCIGKQLRQGCCRRLRAPVRTARQSTRPARIADEDDLNILLLNQLLEKGIKGVDHARAAGSISGRGRIVEKEIPHAFVRGHLHVPMPGEIEDKTVVALALTAQPGKFTDKIAVGSLFVGQQDQVFLLHLPGAFMSKKFGESLRIPVSVL